MSNPDDALQSAVELAADVAAAAGVPPFDVAVAVGGTGAGAEADEDNVDANNDDAAALAAAAAAVAQASAPSGAGGPAKKRRKTGRKKENPDDVSGSFLLLFANSCFVRHTQSVIVNA